jgi:excisionase family DNA binding protein
VRRTRTVRESAAEIGVSTDVVRDWIHSGELPAKFCGNKYLVLDRVLEEFIEGFAIVPAARTSLRAESSAPRLGDADDR